MSRTYVIVQRGKHGEQLGLLNASYGPESVPGRVWVRRYYRNSGRWTRTTSTAQALRIAIAAELQKYGLRFCRECLCNEDDACEGGCAWYSADLCTTCYVKQQTTGARAARAAMDKFFFGRGTR